MFDKYFSLLYQSALSHKKTVLVLVLLVSVAATLGLYFVRYDGNIDTMLPPDKEIARSMDFLRDSSFSDKIIVSLALVDPQKTKTDLFQAVDTLSGSLKPPLFTKVISGISVSNVMDEFSVLQYGPQVLTEKDLAVIDSQLNEKTVSGKLKSIYLQSFRPESIFTASLARTDPMGIKSLLLDKIRALPASMNYDVTVEDGHFLSRDGRHAMLIIQTPVKMMDAQRSKELVKALNEQLRLLPKYVSADVVSGHLHTVSNERVIKRDIMVASTISTVAFLLLFLLVFRDFRVIFVFIVPLVAVIWSIIIAAGMQGSLSYLVIGFGSAIAGISSDYGLHVYIALKRKVDSIQMLKLARLLTIDAATTMACFGVLYFSQIRGYHQLALFSMLCIVLCLLFSLFVLPLTLLRNKPGPGSDSTPAEKPVAFRFPAKTCISVWLVLTAIACYYSLSVKIDTDLKKFDGSEPAVLQAEKNFHAVWGGQQNQAIFVVSGNSLEEAMEKNDAVYREASRTVSNNDFTSLALFWPSQKQRAENRERWDRFWSDGREKRLRELIRGTATAHGFTDQAFAPFFAGLYARQETTAVPSETITHLQDRFVMNRNGSWRILSFFPDKQEYLDSLQAVTDRIPGTFIVSNKAISATIAEFTAKETRILAPLAVLFNLVLAWLFFRNWKLTLISMVPIVTGVAWFVGIMSFLNIPLNAVNIVASIISTGVIVDYGIGVTYEYRYNLRIGTVIAVSLSATTNIIGCGALLSAKYPSLFSTAIAMVICMVIGYLSSVIVVPSLCSLLDGAEDRSGS